MEGAESFEVGMSLALIQEELLEEERGAGKQGVGSGQLEKAHENRVLSRAAPRATLWFLFATLLLFLLFPGPLKLLPVNISDRFATPPTLWSKSFLDDLT